MSYDIFVIWRNYTVVLYCWCHSDSASVLLYFTFLSDLFPLPCGAGSTVPREGFDSSVIMFFYKMISSMSASHSAQKCAPSKYKLNSRELRPILYFSVVLADATLALFIYFQILISVNKPCDLETKSFKTTCKVLEF